MKYLKMESYGTSFTISVADKGDICLQAEDELHYLSPEDAKVLGAALISIAEGEKDD